MTSILEDMDELLGSDNHFLLSNWLNSAKSKATTHEESYAYEWNARTQITVWGRNSTLQVFKIQLIVLKKL
jgi:alpha-N-acetylglucosaminidase